MYVIALLPDYHRAKFTGTDNYSYEQDSHQQTRVHVMHHCIKKKKKKRFICLNQCCLDALLVTNFNTPHVMSLNVKAISPPQEIIEAEPTGGRWVEGGIARKK